MTRPSPLLRCWLLLVLFVACWFLAFVFYSRFYLFVGVNDYGVWFLDSYAILASNDAITHGLDPWAVNPFDPFHRPHVYSHWWLHLRDLGLTRAHNVWFGLALVGGFFTAALTRLRPRTPGEVLWYLAVICASPIVLAVNRANNDLAVFAVLAPVVPCLLSERRYVRLLAVPLIAAAAGLKFYPAIAAFVLLAGDDTREVRARVLIGALVVAFVLMDVAPDIAHLFGGREPKAAGLMTFGAGNLFEACGLAAGGARLAGLALGGVLFALFWRVRWFEGWEITSAGRNAWLSFVLGATLLAGCFFTGSNFAYRWVYAVWLAPLLWSLPRDESAPPRARQLARITGVLLLLALWADAAMSAGLARYTGRVSGEGLVNVADRFFLLEQPLTWAFFTGLLIFLAHFARRGVRVLLAPANVAAPSPSAQ